MRRRNKGSAAFAALSMTALCVWGMHAWGREDSEFPDGYDAVQAAPDSHKVIFENALVRVLEVTAPPNGQTEPMHHHRWPSFFLDWDTGQRGAGSRGILVDSLDEAGTHARDRDRGK
jgi:hypothetical protein